MVDRRPKVDRLSADLVSVDPSVDGQPMGAKVHVVPLSYTQLDLRHATEIRFEVAKAGYLQSVDLDVKLGFPSGTRTRDLRVSSPAFFQPAVTTPTDWAKSLWLGSFSSGWTVALFLGSQVCGVAGEAVWECLCECECGLASHLTIAHVGKVATM